MCFEAQRLGLGALVREELAPRGTVLVGESAGAITCGASVATVLWKGWDARRAVPDAWADYAGIGLAPAALFCHHAEGWAGTLARRAPELAAPVLALADGEALLLPGSGAVVRLPEDPAAAAALAEAAPDGGG